jgi:hypothetical protein
MNWHNNRNYRQLSIIQGQINWFEDKPWIFSLPPTNYNDQQWIHTRL